jgi:Protein of unknown function (DUF2905)
VSLCSCALNRRLTRLLSRAATVSQGERWGRRPRGDDDANSDCTRPDPGGEWSAVAIKRLGLGRLPGDLVIKHKKFVLYFPFTTGLLISAVLTLIFWLANR